MGALRVRRAWRRSPISQVIAGILTRCQAREGGRPHSRRHPRPQSLDARFRGHDKLRILSCPRKRASRRGAATRRSRVQRLVQVAPFRVELLDEREFPLALPFLELLLARDGFVDVAVRLVPDQHFHLIFRRKRRSDACAMLMSAQRKVVGDPNVERAVSPTRHDIDSVGSFAQRRLLVLRAALFSPRLDARFRGHDTLRILSCPRKRASRRGAATRRSRVQRLVQVAPFRVERLDEREFPLALPFLELLFARDGLVDISVSLVPDEHFHLVFCREGRTDSRAMSMRSRGEIVGDADIQRAVSPTRHDINGIGSFAQGRLPVLRTPQFPHRWMPAFAGMTLGNLALVCAS